MPFVLQQSEYWNYGNQRVCYSDKFDIAKSVIQIQTLLSFQVLAILVLGLISYGSYYVVFVLLWPFFLPIMWALMTGLVIHPHKTYLAAAMRQTLADMAASEKTTIVAVMYGCVGLVDGACEAIGGYVVAKWKMVSAIAVVFGIAQATMTLDPVNTLKY